MTAGRAPKEHENALLLSLRRRCAPVSTPPGGNRAGRGPRAYGSAEGNCSGLTRHLALSASSHPNTPKSGVLGTPRPRLGHVPGYYQPRLTALRLRARRVFGSSALCSHFRKRNWRLDGVFSLRARASSQRPMAHCHLPIADFDTLRAGKEWRQLEGKG